MVIGAIAIVVVAIVGGQCRRQVAEARDPRHRRDRRLGATVTVAFAVVYLNLSARDPRPSPSPSERTAALYFTMTTLTTVGYGDIAARTDAARIAVMVQFLFNVAVIGTTARLIVGTVRRSGERAAPRA